jgi:hypothetical protein
MGVDAKLAVVCKKEEKMTVVGQILHTLNKLALDELLADKPKEKK